MSKYVHIFMSLESDFDANIVHLGHYGRYDTAVNVLTLLDKYPQA